MNYPREKQSVVVPELDRVLSDLLSGSVCPNLTTVRPPLCTVRPYLSTVRPNLSTVPPNLSTVRPTN